MAKNINELSVENEKLKIENGGLWQKLKDAMDLIDAIKIGSIDALVTSLENDLKVYTIESADKPYRILIEKMHEGAVTLNEDGRILYCNSYFANMVNLPLQKVIGTIFEKYIDTSSKKNIKAIYKQGSKNAFK